MLLYVENISILYPEDATKAVTDVNARLSELFKIIKLGPAHHFLSIQIHRKATGTGISLGQKAFITMNLK
jgi:hypothetical protein